MVCHVQAWGTGVRSVHNAQIVHRNGLPRQPLVGIRERRGKPGRAAYQRARVAIRMAGHPPFSRLLGQRRQQRPVAHAARDSTTRTRKITWLSPAANTIALSTNSRLRDRAEAPPARGRAHSTSGREENEIRGMT